MGKTLIVVASILLILFALVFILERFSSEPTQKPQGLMSKLSKWLLPLMGVLMTLQLIAVLLQ